MPTVASSATRSAGCIAPASVGLDLLAANEEALGKAAIEIRYLDGWLETNKDEREILRIRRAGSKHDCPEMQIVPTELG